MRLLLLSLLLLAPLGAASAAPEDPDLLGIRRRIHSLLQIIQSGRVEEALRTAEATRAELRPDMALEPEWVGFLRLYQFMALYQSERWADAYALALARPPLPFTLAPANEAYMASVMVELGVRLGKPPEEILRWGTLAADKRESAGDLANALEACAKTCEALGLLDQEPMCQPLARRLIAGATRSKQPRWVIHGYSRLVDAAYRSGDLGTLPELRRELLAATAQWKLGPELENEQDRVLERMRGDAELPSHRPQLMYFRSH